jgi:transglutaminase-like putative cysteine protease
MSGYHHWVLLTLVMAAFPSLLRLPPWVAGIALAGGVLHYAGPWRKGWYGRAAGALLLAATAVAIWFSFESWFSGDAVLSFFIVVVFLKWGEAQTRRDYLLLIFAAVILAAVGTLYWENLLNLLHMLAVVFLLTASLVAIHIDDRRSNVFFLIRRSGLLFGLGLPLMLLLFLTFPRIPGPLWDLGLAFGLPVKAMMDRGAGEFGKVKSLQPGGIHRASQEKESVLVAEFEGAVPSKSRLYWRGPVFWDYDGESWKLPDGWDNRTNLRRRAIRTKTRLDRELHFRKDPVRYTLRVMPNGGRWLYGLDVPAAPAPEAFISDEYQLLSIRQIDDQEPKFEMLSYLEYAAGVELTPEQRARGLSWPENTNPRLRALGRELAQRHRNADDILHQALSLLADGTYRFDSGYIVPPGKDSLDRFFFDEKKGGAEYLAGSFVMLMRAAGVPARMVSGYRGGTIIALTNFVIVKRADAHAWVEVWQDGKGWSRVEPKDIVLPLEVKNPEQQADKNKESAVKMEVKKTAEAPPVKGPDKTDKAGKPAPVKREEGWKLPSISSLLGGLQKWVIRYDPDRQMEVLKGVGLKEGNWLDLLIGGAAGVLSLLGIYLSAAWWRGRRRVDRVAETWLRFCRRLERLGPKKTGQECPRDYLLRVSREQPELAAAAEDIIVRYIDIRYGEDGSTEAAALFRRQVQRFISMT